MRTSHTRSLRRSLAGISTAALVVLSLAACGSDDGDGEGGEADGGPATADIRVWLNGADTPQAARDYLKTEFEKENPGSTLTIEEQQWEGLVERLTTTLSSKTETPDVVEIGNTQAATFAAAGAFSDLSDQLDELGGDDLLPGFVDAGSYEGKTYAVPYYAGGKYVFYRKDLFDKAGLAVPTTTQEFVDAAATLKEDNPKPANFSGFWFPGQDWRNAVTFVWNAGGEIATEDGGSWSGQLETAESQEGLQQVQDLMQQASGAAKDGNETDPQIPFCAGEVGMMSAPGWVNGLIEDAEAGCPELADKIGVFALPGSDGQPAPVLLGGSNIAVAKNSPNQDLADEAVAIMLSDGYQTILAENGLTPARTSLADLLGDDQFATATIAAASNAKLTPAAPGWAKVEGARILEDLFVEIANGGDVAELAKEADDAMEEQLNS
ncbi:extracellular solute-binding protein [Nocardioides sp. C4-1]|uniref:extracellular solute-binding protein n=1 Tax=Nocardioides sp. C4-1 TaxID=3151851 RepID=UPI00326600BF